MKFPRGQRWRWGLGSVVMMLVIVMSVKASQQNKDAPEIAQPTPRKQSSAAAAPNGDRIDGIQLERLKRSRLVVKKVDIFSAKSWYVPPPPPPAAPPPPPSAPPLPFTFIGKIQEPQGKLTIFLADGNSVRLVSEGDTIDNTYSVNGVADGKLCLTYLPLKIKQYIDLGEAP